jgi:hypothetical protein
MMALVQRLLHSIRLLTAISDVVQLLKAGLTQTPRFDIDLSGNDPANIPLTFPNRALRFATEHIIVSAQAK